LRKTIARFRKATIKDVAARSGVSTTTVSNFVSGHENVCSPETAERIRAAIAALHYAPSSLTRGLHNRATRTIGVCLPHPLDPDVSFGFFFLERLWTGILEEADRQDYCLLHYPQSVRESNNSTEFLDGRVDAVLLRSSDNQRASQLAAAGMPTVLLTRSLKIPEGCGATWADESQTVGLILNHLWELGHRRIAHIAGPVGARTMGIQSSMSVEDGGADIAIQRIEGYIRWMEEHHRFDPDLVAYARAWAAPQAMEFLQRWRSLSSPPTAIFCVNDAQALDVLAGARLIGWRIPEELSVVGVDNSPEARDSTPPLTSVEVPMNLVGREAMRIVLRMIGGTPIEDCRVALPVTALHVRRSSAVCVLP
jgi:DNA-binding LacI/PurR family transcriptional regulator